MPILYWILLGGVCLGLEIFVVPIFYMIYFGIAAWVIALLLAVEIDIATPWQWIIFGVLAVGLLVSTRHIFKDMLKGDVVNSGEDGSKDYSAVSGNAIATVIEGFTHGNGVVEWRGARWKAQISTDVTNTDQLKNPPSIGEKVKVLQQKNLTLIISPLVSS